MGTGNSIYDEVPKRDGYEREFVSEKSFNKYSRHKWDKVKDPGDGSFTTQFTDEAAGKQFLMEIPTDEYTRFCDEHKGGKQTRMEREALNGSHKDTQGGKQTVVIEERHVPAQASIRRKEG